MLGSELLPQDVGPLVATEHLQPSPARFADGAQYRVEIPSVEGPAVFEAVLAEAHRRGVPVHRVSQGSGVTLLSAAERAEWVASAAASGTEVSVYVRPTASWGPGASWLSATGAPLAGQVHGVGQLAAALDQVRRAVESGFRSVLVTDVGVLAGIADLTREGRLPADLQIKAGVQMGVANPLSVRVVAGLGATTVNVPSDCSLTDLAAIRRLVDNPLDIYIESPDDLGGIIRTHELADIITVAAPVYLKFGLRNAPSLYPSGTHTEATAVALARERVRRAQLALETLHEVAPDLVTSSGVPADLAVPQPPA
ncbi:hypothetical protein GC722_01255 [Auraticoccus sp. F435]|uniref:Peptidase U32 n=1 Tax=Auraticoccus cholistanensis TaxID=2656650 RepID=A0A6A9UP64_9ACTN|nr:U32 family peptidase [Auraticoccus cholistanensis]MVA74666.1 hypothetical protein [Auraticoccus cholistanensis]